MSEDLARVAQALKSQAEAQLQTGPDAKAGAIAGLAIVTALLAIHEDLQEVTYELRHITNDSCSDPDHHGSG